MEILHWLGNSVLRYNNWHNLSSIMLNVSMLSMNSFNKFDIKLN
jgi:hypothetical protein